MATTTVFINNRSQAIRLPAELHLPDNLCRAGTRG
jgi:virulence-associated protein VagC